MKEIQQLRRIAVKLGVSGTVTPLVETRLYRGGYGFVTLQAYVPYTQNRCSSDNTDPLCEVYRITVDKFGNRKQFNNVRYNMLLVGDAEIDNAKYMVFECPLPKVFTDTAGDLEMAFAYSEVRKIENNPDCRAVTMLCSGVYSTTVDDSVVPDGEIVPAIGGEWSEINGLPGRVELLEDSVDALLQPPDCSDVNKVGEPVVTIIEDGRFKFSNLKGGKGDTGELSVGEVETVEYTEDAAVDNSGTSTDAILDFKIPRGAPGKPAIVTVGKVETLPPGDPAKVEKRDGTKENESVFDFYIPEGVGFRIDKTYSSVAEMNAGFETDDVRLYGFVIIDTGNVEDEDNAELYIKTETKYKYLTDMSGAQGIKGEAATIDVDTVDVLAPDEAPTVENIGTKNAAMLKFKLPKGATVSVDNAVVQLGENDAPRVENLGNEHNAVFKFYLPQGKKGDSGDPANIDELDHRYYWADNPTPVATADENGTVKLGSDSVQSVSANAPSEIVNRSYSVQLDENGRMVVNVPWTNTTYDIATASDVGLVKPIGVITKPAIQAASNISGRYYGVQISSDGTMFVNVPWKDTTIATNGSYPNMTVGNASKLTTAHDIDGVEFDGSGSITHFGVCGSDIGTAEKSVTLVNLTNKFKLIAGARVSVLFQHANAIDYPTLNVNNTGARLIRFKTGDAFSNPIIKEKSIVDFVFDGTNWVVIGNDPLLSYPIGAIYISVSRTSPAALFGGSWEQIAAGNYLKAITSGTGGTSEDAGLPNITGNVSTGYLGRGNLNSYSHAGALSGENNDAQYGSQGLTQGSKTLRIVFDASQDNPIYGKSDTVTPKNIGVFMWRRTA